ncbi:M16 family metallopeptidase [Ketogulonicigenium vulgare]|uniref:Peptidase M16-like protein n=1 Tax=Ketogulonicigenium vulgare (strain WSH-001) TaxID=759362 RepID=F9Y4D0_KETVW|nr:pitrilysin family protein [Ketogulonicigenium vulgare]ADO43461.1 peptidase, M16 family protein [Ketogulonicigenium vulgare Y25]AEM41743.1 Peptidase M16-like protein [Ketogulonicigenium vulgare WSH-001]ALJ81851.1 zinc protease [Ketogulonicigenium vulgare]ANW34505.1 zinc protease [Ketogulonicigenium vulgare]AOZ55497.1 peptidase, M16 family protein [Ketogulonicigenium vulgare]
MVHRVVAAGFALALAAMAALSPQIALAQDNVTTHQLENGLDIVVIEDHRAPVVTQMIWYRVGSADEPKGQGGIAHFLEHLMFKGTDTMASGAFSAAVAENGGEDNAFTSYDYTAYFQRVAADRLPLMMQMEAGRMRGLLLTPEEIATERNVILEERNQRTDSNAGALAQEQARAALYLNHPYGLPVIGWRHEIEGLDLPEIRAFYDLYYAPNNAILVIAGDVNPADVIALAEEYYGPIAPSDNLPPRTRPSEPPQLAARHLDFSDARVAQPYLTRTYIAPNRISGEQGQAAALTYLAEILGGSSFTSVLGQALAFENPIALNVYAGYGGAAVDSSTFSLSLVPAPGITLAEAEEDLDGALQRFLDRGVDESQLDRIRTQLRASEIYARDDVFHLANRYGAALASGLSVGDIQSWPEVLQSVTADEIMQAARDVLDARRSVTLFVTPETPAPEGN